jgi:uncharacterized Zn finger protein
MSWYNTYDDDFDEDDYTLSEYTTQSSTIILDGPVRAVSKRGAIGREWWGVQWVEALERIGHGGRLDRGKRYARNGSVLRLEIGQGIAYAEVSGSYGNSYRTAIHVRVLDNEQWEKALRALSEQAIYAAKLLAGEMPGDVEAVFQDVGLSLFPLSRKDIQFECSCPDYGDPCKHCAAVYYLLAEQFDADPFILFHLRGRNRDSVLETLRVHRGAGVDDVNTLSDEIAQAAPSLDADLQQFWGESSANLVRAMPVRGELPFALRQLGKPPGNVADDLRDIYATVAQEALRWLGLDGETG